MRLYSFGAAVAITSVCLQISIARNPCSAINLEFDKRMKRDDCDDCGGGGGNSEDCAGGCKNCCGGNNKGCTNGGGCRSGGDGNGNSLLSLLGSLGLVATTQTPLLQALLAQAQRPTGKIKRARSTRALFT